MIKPDNFSLKGIDEDFFRNFFVSVVTISFQKTDEEPLIYDFCLSELAPMCYVLKEDYQVHCYFHV